MSASKPQFKVGDRVTWRIGNRKRVGVVKDVHMLGGHGRAYEVAVDGEVLPEEITEAELSLEAQ